MFELEGADCVAIEVKYHFSCYRDLTRYQSAKPPVEKVESTHAEAYELFCKEVENKVIKNKEPLRLTKLNKMFVKQVKVTTGEDIEYRASYLKK